MQVLSGNAEMICPGNQGGRDIVSGRLGIKLIREDDDMSRDVQRPQIIQIQAFFQLFKSPIAKQNIHA